MNSSQFILIQVNPNDKFYELARIRRYVDYSKGYYCDGFAQNNGDISEFSLHLGRTESEIKRKFIILGYPADKSKLNYLVL